jgi:hypothetical protein
MQKNKKRYGFKRKPRQKAKLPLSEFFLSKSGKSKIQELRIGSDIGGRRVPRSGGIPCVRGDAENSTVLVEAKQTKKPYFFLSERILQKIDKESFGCGKTPSVVIEYLSMPFGTEASWAVIPKPLLYEFLEESKLFINNSLKFRTKKKRIKVKISDLKDIDQEATAKGKIPVIMAEFKWMPGGVASEWAILPYSIFLKIVKSEIRNPESEPEEADPLSETPEGT